MKVERRAFMRFNIKALGVLALGSGILLSGCSTPEPTQDPKVSQVKKKEYETDISKLHETTAGYTKDLTLLDSEQVSEKLGLKDITYSKLLEALHQSYESPNDILASITYKVDSGNASGITFKNNLNILFLLDASGSMGKEIGNKTQMEIAKASLENFMSALPSEANVGLRVYGHKGQGTDADKEKSCASSELVYGVENYNESKFSNALNKIKPSGWTPTDLALQQAAEDLKGYSSEENTNIVYLVSDGISTCDDNPVESAQALIKSDSKPLLNVIGFNVDEKARKQLEEIALSTKGEYADVTTAVALTDEFTKLNAMAKEWQESLKTQQGEISENATLNMVAIYNYAARLQQKVILERANIDYAIDSYVETALIDDKTAEKLKKENETYHVELENNVVKFKENLRNVNSENSEEAVKEIESLLQGK